MKILLGISENNQENSVFGIVLAAPFLDIGQTVLKDMGFLVKDIKQNMVIMKSDKFYPGMLNDFSMLSGLEFSDFKFFICKKSEYEPMLSTIQQDNSL